MIDQINTHRAENIITVEDPIEFIHPSKQSIVSQREVGKDTGSFAKALKSALRQDPDVILVGELRDLETISLALTAAETGHLVFGTLHTSDGINYYKNFRCFKVHETIRTNYVSRINKTSDVTTAFKKKGWRKNWLS